MKNYVMGDTHGNFFYLNHFIVKKNPDNIFICGDFGVWRRNLGNPEFGFLHDNIIPINTKIYFCDGNHEDHIYLKELVDKHGYKNPIEITKNIFYCPRGSELELEDGRKILFFGGAKSTDSHWRTAYYDWFPSEEVISENDYNRLDFSKKYDIIISHTCPEMVVQEMMLKVNSNTNGWNRDSSCVALQGIFDAYHPKVWYFGHWHTHTMIKKKECTFYALNKTPDDGCCIKFK